MKNYLLEEDEIEENNEEMKKRKEGISKNLTLLFNKVILIDGL
jgi:hypothetical protein